MGNILEYLQWRGDITFEERPFNEIDNLVLSEICYARLEEYVKGRERVTLGEAAKIFFEGEHDPSYVHGIEALRLAAQTDRYRDVVIHHNEALTHTNTQFGMMCFDLPGNITYIAFRGTDATIAGWREDFAISYQKTIGQKMAVLYLQMILQPDGRTYYLGGHSKGGNLAVFASMMLEPEYQDRIACIYDNDGPGISPEMMNEQGFEAIRDKIVMYCPAYCVIGKLFELDIPKIVVESDAKAMKQHDAVSWRVMGTEFVRAQDFAPESELINNIFRDWINSATPEERVEFTKEFFDALEAGGAETISEVSGGGLSGIMSIVTSMKNFSPTTKSAVGKLLISARNDAVMKITDAVKTVGQGVKNLATGNEHKD